jgi:hypothetical protein
MVDRARASRRNHLRLNGVARRADGQTLVVTKQVYGNCQQYIQARPIVGALEPVTPTASTCAVLRRRPITDLSRENVLSLSGGSQRFFSSPLQQFASVKSNP